jgi:hypothetical protein
MACCGLLNEYSARFPSASIHILVSFSKLERVIEHNREL